MNILTAENITKSYGERKLFDHADFYLQEGDKVGILGINGTGKSTLLRMIAGISEPDDGKIITANNIVISYLPQNPTFLTVESKLNAIKRQANIEGVDKEAISKAILTRLGVYDFGYTCVYFSGVQG